MFSAAWLLTVAVCIAAEALTRRRRLARVRRMLLAYESAARVFDPRPLDPSALSRDLRLLMKRHALTDALFPNESFEQIAADLRLSDGAAATDTAVRAKMRLLLYRIYGCEEHHARESLSVDYIARRFCEGPVAAFCLLRPGRPLPGARLLIGAAWVAALYTLLLRYGL